MEKQRFKVWIEQINQAMYEIEAESSAEAQIKAKQRWREENKPFVLSVESD